MGKQFLLIFITLFVGSCSKTEEPNVEQIIDVPIEHDYQEVEKYFLEWDSIFDVNNNKYYVYFYSLNCSHCLSLKNWVIEKALSRNDIYFVKSSKKVVISNDTKNTIGAGKVEDISILGYPSMIEITNWKVTKNVAGKSQIENLFI